MDILSLSFGFPRLEENIDKMLDKYADGKGKLILAAASNDGTRRLMTYPASRGHGIIAVNSATGDGSTSRFNPPLGGEKNFSIIGEEVQSSWVHNTTRILSGTSVATPVAAGVTALLLEIAIKQDVLSGGGPEVLERCVKRYGGITALLKSMSSAEKKDDKYSNILPWQLLALDEDILDSERTLFSEAVFAMRKVLNDANELLRW